MQPASEFHFGAVVAEAKYARFHVVWRVLGVLLAMIAVFAALVSRGLSGVEAGGAWGALEIACVPLALLVLMAIALAAYHRHDRLVVHALGVEQRLGRRRVAFAFEEVVASRTWRDASAAPKSIDVRLRDGARATIDTPSAGPATDALVHALDERHRARATEAFEQGRVLRFGDIEVDLARGIVREGHVLGWSMVDAVTTTPELMVVRERLRNGASKDWTVVMPETNEDIDGLASTIRLGRSRARVGEAADAYR